MRYLITFSYDGSVYKWYQKQPKTKTIQGEIEKVLRKINGSKAVKIHASGRTDAGVHAISQKAHFDLKKEIDPDKLKHSMNSLLPGDIYIKDIEVVSDIFHARFNVKAKEYIYKINMDEARDYLKIHQEKVLKEYNTLLFKEQWDKYAKGNISSWEMEALCFYYHDHELKYIDNQKYGIKNFFDLPVTPEVEYFFKRNGKQIPIYKLCRIAGTAIGKNDTRHSVTLLTVNGVVNVKFSRDYYAMFNRQLSEKNEQGVKKVKEKGWFTRGTKLLVTGYRQDDTFISKKYQKTGGHQLYMITEVEGKNINITSERYGINDE